MSTQPVLSRVLLGADTDPSVRAAAAYLARFKDATHVHTESDLRAFLGWCTERRLPPLAARRVHIECMSPGLSNVLRFGRREQGPVLLNRHGARMDRHAATRRLRRLGIAANVRLPRMHPHMLRHTFVTTMLDAGVDLRDVQIPARHADRRTTMRYDRARKNLDRYPNYILAAHMASDTEDRPPAAISTTSREGPPRVRR